MRLDGIPSVRATLTAVGVALLALLVWCGALELLMWVKGI